MVRRSLSRRDARRGGAGRGAGPSGCGYERSRRPQACGPCHPYSSAQPAALRGCHGREDSLMSVFDFGIRAALPCYGWRVYFRGIRAPFDTHRDETGEHALSAWAMRHAWALVQQQTRKDPRDYPPGRSRLGPALTPGGRHVGVWLRERLDAFGERSTLRIREANTMPFEPFTPRVAALLTDGRTRDTSYGNDVAPSVGIYDDDTGYDWLRLFQAEADAEAREYPDGGRYVVMVDASNELGCMTCLIETEDEAEAVRAYVDARTRLLAWEGAR